MKNSKLVHLAISARTEKSYLINDNFPVYDMDGSLFKPDYSQITEEDLRYPTFRESHDAGYNSWLEMELASYAPIIVWSMVPSKKPLNQLTKEDRKLLEHEYRLYLRSCDEDRGFTNS